MKITLEQLSGDPIKRAIRSVYWQKMGQYNPLGSSSYLLTLPGESATDAMEAQENLGIPRNQMVCVERDRRVSRQFNRVFPGTDWWVGDVFNVVHRLAIRGAWRGQFGVVDLDLCEGANKNMLPQLKLLRNSSILAPNALIGVTVCRRVPIPGAPCEAERRVKAVLSPCVELMTRPYHNGTAHGNMVTMIMQIKGMGL